jgi:hypothetical protein
MVLEIRVHVICPHSSAPPQCAFFFGMPIWSTTTQKKSVRHIVGIIQALPKNSNMLFSLKRINDTRHNPTPAAAVTASRAIVPARRWCLGKER